MHSLSLHVSTLNDDEYTLFTSSFADLLVSLLTTDDDFEKHTVCSPNSCLVAPMLLSDLHVTDVD